MSKSPRITIRADRGSALIRASRVADIDTAQQAAATIRARQAEAVLGEARGAVVAIPSRRRVVQPSHTSPAPEKCPKVFYQKALSGLSVEIPMHEHGIQVVTAVWVRRDSDGALVYVGNRITPTAVYLDSLLPMNGLTATLE